MRKRVLLGLAFASGCAVVPGGSPAPLQDEACVTGAVAVRGLPPADETVVRAPDGTLTPLRGDLARNVRMLSGASVTVCGGGHEPDRPLEPTSIDLLEVDGLNAVLGRLVPTGGGWAIIPLYVGDPVPLASVPGDLAVAASEVVWVAGDWLEELFGVQAYGVLRGWR